MSTIQVRCVDQTLQIVNAPKIASGGVKEDSLEVEFCPLWDGFSKTAIFFNARDAVYYVVLDDHGQGLIPWEVMQNAGKMYFGIFGTKDGVTRTSEVLTYQIVEGAITQNTIQPAEPTPTQYEQMVELVAGKAPVASPTFTGTPTAPTAAVGTNTQQIATTAFVAAALAGLVNSAPETLDTLEELAEALGNDPNFATTITNLIGTKAANSDLTAHTGNNNIHVTAAQKTAWANHVANTNIHISTEERSAWNAKQKAIIVGSTAPENVTGLVAGDIYIYCPTMGE